MSVQSIQSLNRPDFIRRFLATKVDNSEGQLNIDIPSASEQAVDQVTMSGSDVVTDQMALRTAQQIQVLSQAGMWGTLPVVVSAAILKSGWQGTQAPFQAHERPVDTRPRSPIANEIEQQEKIMGRLNAVSDTHSAEYILNDEIGPASASGDQVWLNPAIASEVFDTEETMAMAMAHEKGHIINGDTTWEPSATSVLWEVLGEAQDRALAKGDSATSELMGQGMSTLEKSFAINAQVNEVDADLTALKILDAAGYDRRPGLAFLLGTTGDSHHLAGPKRLEVIQSRLQGSSNPISAQEMAEIRAMAANPGQ